MSRILFLVTMTMVFTFHSVNSFSQKKLDYNDLDKYIKTQVDSFAMPGLAVGVIKDGEVAFMGTYGFSNTETKDKVDENTLFGIASCSKAFTAACLAILVQEGKVKWEDKVVDHYPLQLYDPYITRELMIKDLLCHRAGYLTFDGDLLWYGTDYSPREIVERFRYRENEFSLREKYGYSNLMFIVAGEVIKAVSGKSWEEFVAEKIFTPLGMNTSTTTNSGFGEGMNVAWPHLEGRPMPFINYDNSGPAAAINTSASELLKWVQLMLNKGIWEDIEIFPEEQYYKLVEPQTIMRSGRANVVDGTHFSTYGLGWAMKDYKGMKVIDHGGGLPGFHSKVVFIPEANLGYVILANEISLIVPALEKDLLDFHVNDSLGWAARYLPYKDIQKTRVAAKMAKMEEERIKNTQPSLSLKDYTGTYEDIMYGDAEMKMKDDKLEIRLVPSGELLVSTMEHWHYDTFKIRVNDPFLPEGFVTFSIGENGSVSGFKINIDNPDFHFYKLDFKKK